MKRDEDEVMERAERGIFDGVVEAWCRNCDEDIRAEPDAETAWCEVCEEVVKIDNPCVMLMTMP